MSFWGVLDTLFRGFLKQAQKKQSTIEHQMEESEDLDTKALVQRYNTSSGDTKLAAALVLKERKSKKHG